MEVCSKFWRVLPHDGRNTSKDVRIRSRRCKFRMDLCEERCITVAMTPTMKSAKATLNNNVWRSPHLARNVGKMLSNVAMMIEGIEGYGEGNTVGAFSNWNFAV